MTMAAICFAKTTVPRLNMTTKSSKFEDRTNQMHAHVNTRTITALLYMRTTYNDFIKRSSHTKEPHRNTHSYHFCTDCVREREKLQGLKRNDELNGANTFFGLSMEFEDVWTWKMNVSNEEKGKKHAEKVNHDEISILIMLSQVRFQHEEYLFVFGSIVGWVWINFEMFRLDSSTASDLRPSFKRQASYS